MGTALPSFCTSSLRVQVHHRHLGGRPQRVALIDQIRVVVIILLPDRYILGDIASIKVARNTASANTVFNTAIQP